MSFLFQLRSFSQVVRRLQVSKFSSSPVVLFDQEIKSDSFATINKKFHIDIKENDASERYIKISELAKGKRFTLQISAKDTEKVFDLLSSNQEGEVEGKEKTYSLTREENSFGKFISLVEKSREGKVYRIAIPDESLGKLVQSLENLKPFLVKNHENGELH